MRICTLFNVIKKIAEYTKMQILLVKSMAKNWHEYQGQVHQHWKKYFCSFH